MTYIKKPADADSDLNPSLFVSKEPYLSKEFLEGEKRNLWPKTWLLACRREQLKRPGDFVTFNVADESIIVNLDQNGELRAFHNVCQHRGRRLTEGCGSVNRFFCRYHGWRWNLDGSNDKIVDQEDWGGTLDQDEVRLKDVRVDSWGGWVFVSMDKEGETLAEFLAPLPHAWRNFDLEKMRYSWAKRVTLNCNWKTALDVFIEGYHAATAHRQTRFPGEFHFSSELFGKHSVYRNRDVMSMGTSETVVMTEQDVKEFPEDFEKLGGAKGRPDLYAKYFEITNRDLDSWVSDRMVRAAKRAAELLPPDAPFLEIMGVIDREHRALGAEEGINWDQLQGEDLAYLGMGWQVFPNIAILPTGDALLAYRALPNGDNPDSCFLDVWSIERYADGQEPPFKQEVFNDWKDTAWPRIFRQDFENLADIQAGMKSSGFDGSRTNPISELPVANFHHYVRKYVEGRAGNGNDVG